MKAVFIAALIFCVSHSVAQESVVIQPDAGEVPQDGSALLQALNSFDGKGGEIVIDGGTWLVHESLRLSDDVTIRGRNQPVIRLPGPRWVKEKASAGDQIIIVNADTEYRAGGELEVVSPGEDKEPLTTVTIKSIEGRILNLVEPLAVEVPAGSRIGYSHNMFRGYGVTNVTLADLTIDGGRDPDIPMPGHARRSAIWIAAPYSYEEGPKGEPASNITIRDCVIANCYGRAVAFYHVVDSAVTGCRISKLADEAINFDHFVRRCRAIENEVDEATVGVEMNDASDCEVLRNRIQNVGVGVRIWWYPRIKEKGINEGNLIQGNDIEGASQSAILIRKNCFHNRVIENTVRGEIDVVESDNEIRGNIQR